MGTPRILSVAVLAIAPALLATDIAYLNGHVRLQNGSAPGHEVEIKLACPGSDPVRQTVANKKGNYYLKVERDEFNHIARALPSTAMDIGSGSLTGACRLIAVLAGYDSSEIHLAAFTIGKDLKLPDLILTPHSTK